MTDSENVIRLKIYGEEFAVKSKADEAYLQDVAEYVDNHMREIAENLPSSQPMVRVAVLAAMNICDELLELRRQKDELQRMYGDRSSELSDQIKEVLFEATGETSQAQR